MPESPQYVVQNWPTTRQFMRHDLEARLTINAPDKVIRGWCADIGEGGLAGVSSARLNLGDEVALEFQLPGTGETVQVRAVVRYAAGFRYGFEFLTLTPVQRTAILEYCARKKK